MTWSFHVGKHVRLYKWDCVISFSIRPLWDNIQVINLLETMWHTYGQFENMGCSAATWYLSVLQIYSCRSVQIYYRSADPGLADSSRKANAFCGHNRAQVFQCHLKLKQADLTYLSSRVLICQSKMIIIRHSY